MVEYHLDHKKEKFPETAVHSKNPIGAEKMSSYLQNYHTFLNKKGK